MDFADLEYRFPTMAPLLVNKLYYWDNIPCTIIRLHKYFPKLLSPKAAEIIWSIREYRIEH